MSTSQVKRKANCELAEAQNAVKKPRQNTTPQLLDFGLSIPKHDMFQNSSQNYSSLLDDQSHTNKIKDKSYVYTSTSASDISTLRLALSENRPILLEGPSGSGKSSLIHHVAQLTGNTNIVRIYMDDQVDIKMLLGSQTVTDTPGEFVFQYGPLSYAIMNGKWVVLENIHRASFELLSALGKLFEENTIKLSERNETLTAKPGFQLLATWTTNASSDIPSQFAKFKRTCYAHRLDLDIDRTTVYLKPQPWMQYSTDKAVFVSHFESSSSSSSSSSQEGNTSSPTPQASTIVEAAAASPQSNLSQLILLSSSASIPSHVLLHHFFSRVLLPSIAVPDLYTIVAYNYPCLRRLSTVLDRVMQTVLCFACPSTTPMKERGDDDSDLEDSTTNDDDDDDSNDDHQHDSEATMTDNATQKPQKQSIRVQSSPFGQACNVTIRHIFRFAEQLSLLLGQIFPTALQQTKSRGASKQTTTKNTTFYQNEALDDVNVLSFRLNPSLSVEVIRLILNIFTSAAAPAPSIQHLSERQKLIGQACYIWGMHPNDFIALTRDYMPTISTQEQTVTIGRFNLSRRSKDRNTQLVDVLAPKFTLTKHSLVNMERIFQSIQSETPMLLVGETGNGKTAIVQHLATMLGNTLHVHNFNQQSESSDLLGGFKPVELQLICKSLMNQFGKLFPRTFNVENNVAFSNKIKAFYLEKKWSSLLKLFQHTVSNVKRLPVDGVASKTKQDGNNDNTPGRTIKPETRQGWDDFHIKLKRFEKQLKHSSSFAFWFAEGTLINAIREGHWVLMDEFNLAPNEVLDRLSSLLENKTGSIILTERGDVEPIRRHPNFRLFACMNPATDAGKKDLPLYIRDRFNELYITDIDDENDLFKIIVDALGSDMLSAHPVVKQNINRIVHWYLHMRQLSKTVLFDGSDHHPHYSTRSLVRALKFAKNNMDHYGAKRALYEGFILSFSSPLNTASRLLVDSLLWTHIFQVFYRQEHANIPDVDPVNREKYTPPSVDQQRTHQQNVISYVEQASSAFPARSRQGGVITGPHAITQGPTPVNPAAAESFIITPTVQARLGDISRGIVSKLPILLQGPTSAGKTSLVTYLAEQTGNTCVRVNNHLHTDVQEYIGSYITDSTGKLVFHEGILVKAMRNGWWIILDELNLAPSEVLESLNRLLDDNSELLIPETQEVVRPHGNFLLFATQNPAGLYGGRKQLSRAFINRFVQLHCDDIPEDELKIILHKRCKLPTSFAEKMVKIMLDLQQRRQSIGSNVFSGKKALLTPRDLFRWADRKPTTLYELAQHGYFLLAERLRNNEAKQVVLEVLQANCGCTLDMTEYYNNVQVPLFDIEKGMITNGYLFSDKSKADREKAAEAEKQREQFQGSKKAKRQARRELERNLKAESEQSTMSDTPAADTMDDTGADDSNDSFGTLSEDARRELEKIGSVAWTYNMKRMFTLVYECILNKEPVLLVGSTGTGKTTICQIIALMLERSLEIINCHQHTETSDLLGGLRPVRNKDRTITELIVALRQFIKTCTTLTSYTHQLAECLAVIETSSTDNQEDLSDHTVGITKIPDVLTEFVKQLMTVAPVCDDATTTMDEQAAITPLLDSYNSILKSLRKANNLSNKMDEYLQTLASNQAEVDANTDGQAQANSKKRGKKSSSTSPTALTATEFFTTQLASPTAAEVYTNIQNTLNTLGTSVTDFIQPLYQRYTTLFEWQDGVLINTMRDGSLLLLDEISLADDAVLERLNSVLEPSRTLFLAEKGGDETESITAHDNFAIIATMNPGGDFGKKELSPALRNRFTEIWIPALDNREDVLGIILERFLLQMKQPTVLPAHGLLSSSETQLVSQWVDYRKSHLPALSRQYAPLLLDFIEFFNGLKLHRRQFSLRDILAWVQFMTQLYTQPRPSLLASYASDLQAHQQSMEASQTAAEPTEAEVHQMAQCYIHAACLVVLDGLSVGSEDGDTHLSLQRVEMCVNQLLSQFPVEKRDGLHNILKYHDAAVNPACVLPSTTTGSGSTSSTSRGWFGVDPFFIPLGPHAHSLSISTAMKTSNSSQAAPAAGEVVAAPASQTISFSIDAESTRINLTRALRALQLPRAILLEGSPGVGKTSLIAALAKLSGHKLVRINLSEQTDMLDLLGSDLPVAGGDGGQFQWCDGVFLQALKAGDWILLDELNLASQSVLEGLNAVLDHRAQIYLPELDQTFDCPPSFRLFAAQNPVAQGGGRKGLPASFLNRFTKVWLHSMTDSDLYDITHQLYPSIPRQYLNLMINFNKAVHEDTMVKRIYGRVGSPWEFNLRDVFRWCDLMNFSLLDIDCILDQSKKQQQQHHLKLQDSSTGTLTTTAADTLERSGSDGLLDFTHPGAFLDIVYLQRMRTPSDRQALLNLFQEMCSTITQDANDASSSGDTALTTKKHRIPIYSRVENTPSVELLPSMFRIGNAWLPRLPIRTHRAPSTSDPLAKLSPLLLHQILRPMEHVARCVSRGWPVILVGDSNTGKTMTVRALAEITNTRLHEIALSSSTDATDLLGCFVQVDWDRHRENIIQSTSELLTFLITCLSEDSQNPEYPAIATFLQSLLDARGAIQSLLNKEQHQQLDASNVNSASSKSFGDETYTTILNAYTLCDEVYHALQQHVRLTKPGFHVHDDTHHTAPGVTVELNKIKISPSSHAYNYILPKHLSPKTLREQLETFQANTRANKASAGRFEWIDGTLIQSLELGHWVVLDNVNFCNPSVLDRLNGLLEPNGTLLVNECGLINGEPRIITPHPNFRIFLTMNPQFGEISRAMRNRCIEIALLTPIGLVGHLNMAHKLVLKRLHHQTSNAATTTGAAAVKSGVGNTLITPSTFFEYQYDSDHPLLSSSADDTTNLVESQEDLKRQAIRTSDQLYVELRNIITTSLFTSINEAQSHAGGEKQSSTVSTTHRSSSPSTWVDMLDIDQVLSHENLRDLLLMISELGITSHSYGLFFAQMHAAMTLYPSLLTAIMYFNTANMAVLPTSGEQTISQSALAQRNKIWTIRSLVRWAHLAVYLYQKASERSNSMQTKNMQPASLFTILWTSFYHAYGCSRFLEHADVKQYIANAFLYCFHKTLLNNLLSLHPPMMAIASGGIKSVDSQFQLVMNARVVAMHLSPLHRPRSLSLLSCLSNPQLTSVIHVHRQLSHMEYIVSWICAHLPLEFIAPALSLPDTLTARSNSFEYILFYEAADKYQQLLLQSDTIKQSAGDEHAFLGVNAYRDALPLIVSSLSTHSDELSLPSILYDLNIPHSMLAIPSSVTEADWFKFNDQTQKGAAHGLQTANTTSMVNTLSHLLRQYITHSSPHDALIRQLHLRKLLLFITRAHTMVLAALANDEIKTEDGEDISTRPPKTSQQVATLCAVLIALRVYHRCISAAYHILLCISTSLNHYKDYGLQGVIPHAQLRASSSTVEAHHLSLRIISTGLCAIQTHTMAQSTGISADYLAAQPSLHTPFIDNADQQKAHGGDLVDSLIQTRAVMVLDTTNVVPNFSHIALVRQFLQHSLDAVSQFALRTAYYQASIDDFVAHVRTLGTPLPASALKSFAPLQVSIALQKNLAQKRGHDQTPAVAVLGSTFNAMSNTISDISLRVVSVMQVLYLSLLSSQDFSPWDVDVLGKYMEHTMHLFTHIEAMAKLQSAVWYEFWLGGSSMSSQQSSVWQVMSVGEGDSSIESSLSSSPAYVWHYGPLLIQWRVISSTFAVMKHFYDGWETLTQAVLSPCMTTPLAIDTMKTMSTHDLLHGAEIVQQTMKSTDHFITRASEALMMQSGGVSTLHTLIGQPALRKHALMLLPTGEQYAKIQASYTELSNALSPLLPLREVSQAKGVKQLLFFDNNLERARLLDKLALDFYFTSHNSNALDQTGGSALMWLPPHMHWTTPLQLRDATVELISNAQFARSPVLFQQAATSIAQQLTQEALNVNHAKQALSAMLFGSRQGNNRSGQQIDTILLREQKFIRAYLLTLSETPPAIHAKLTRYLWNSLKAKIEITTGGRNASQLRVRNLPSYAFLAPFEDAVVIGLWEKAISTFTALMSTLQCTAGQQQPPRATFEQLSKMIIRTLRCLCVLLKFVGSPVPPSVLEVVIPSHMTKDDGETHPGLFTQIFSSLQRQRYRSTLSIQDIASMTTMINLLTTAYGFSNQYIHIHTDVVFTMYNIYMTLQSRYHQFVWNNSLIAPLLTRYETHPQGTYAYSKQILFEHADYVDLIQGQQTFEVTTDVLRGNSNTMLFTAEQLIPSLLPTAESKQVFPTFTGLGSSALSLAVTALTVKNLPAKANATSLAKRELRIKQLSSLVEHLLVSTSIQSTMQSLADYLTMESLSNDTLNMNNADTATDAVTPYGTFSLPDGTVTTITLDSAYAPLVSFGYLLSELIPAFPSAKQSQAMEYGTAFSTVEHHTTRVFPSQTDVLTLIASSRHPLVSHILPLITDSILMIYEHILRPVTTPPMDEISYKAYCTQLSLYIGLINLQLSLPVAPIDPSLVSTHQKEFIEQLANMAFNELTTQHWFDSSLVNAPALTAASIFNSVQHINTQPITATLQISDTSNAADEHLVDSGAEHSALQLHTPVVPSVSDPTRHVPLVWLSPTQLMQGMLTGWMHKASTIRKVLSYRPQVASDDENGFFVFFNDVHRFAKNYASNNQQKQQQDTTSNVNNRTLTVSSSIISLITTPNQQLSKLAQQALTEESILQTIIHEFLRRIDDKYAQIYPDICSLLISSVSTIRTALRDLAALLSVKATTQSIGDMNLVTTTTHDTSSAIIDDSDTTPATTKVLATTLYSLLSFPTPILPDSFAPDATGSPQRDILCDPLSFLLSANATTTLQTIAVIADEVQTEEKRKKAEIRAQRLLEQEERQAALRKRFGDSYGLDVIANSSHLDTMGDDAEARNIEAALSSTVDVTGTGFEGIASDDEDEDYVSTVHTRGNNNNHQQPSTTHDFNQLPVLVFRAVLMRLIVIALSAASGPLTTADHLHNHSADTGEVNEQLVSKRKTMTNAGHSSMQAELYGASTRTISMVSPTLLRLISIIFQRVLSTYRYKQKQIEYQEYLQTRQFKTKTNHFTVETEEEEFERQLREMYPDFSSLYDDILDDKNNEFADDLDDSKEAALKAKTEREEQLRIQREMMMDSAERLHDDDYNITYLAFKLLYVCAQNTLHVGGIVTAPEQQQLHDAIHVTRSLAISASQSAASMLISALQLTQSSFALLPAALDRYSLPSQLYNLSSAFLYLSQHTSLSGVQRSLESAHVSTTTSAALSIACSRDVIVTLQGLCALLCPSLAPPPPVDPSSNKVSWKNMPTESGDASLLYYDAWHDPNMAEAQKLVRPLSSYQNRVRTLLVIHPSNPTLQQLALISARLATQPLQAPLMQLLVGLEALLKCTQQWDGPLKDSRTMKIFKPPPTTERERLTYTEDDARISQLFVLAARWRKLELWTWPMALKRKDDEFEQRIIPWWSKLHAIIHCSEAEMDSYASITEDTDDQTGFDPSADKHDRNKGEKYVKFGLETTNETGMEQYQKTIDAKQEHRDRRQALQKKHSGLIHHADNKYENYLLQLHTALQEFIVHSPLGELKGRLAILLGLRNQLHLELTCEMTLGAQNKTVSSAMTNVIDFETGASRAVAVEAPPLAIRQKICALLEHIFRQYAQFLPHVKKHMQEEKLPLEKTIVEHVAITVWDVTNYEAYNKSSQKSHHKILTLASNYELILKTPFTSLLQKLNAQDVSVHNMHTAALVTDESTGDKPSKAEKHKAPSSTNIVGHNVNMGHVYLIYQRAHSLAVIAAKKLRKAKGKTIKRRAPAPKAASETPAMADDSSATTDPETMGDAAPVEVEEQESDSDEFEELTTPHALSMRTSDDVIGVLTRSHTVPDTTKQHLLDLFGGESVARDASSSQFTSIVATAWAPLFTNRDLKLTADTTGDGASTAATKSSSYSPLAVLSVIWRLLARDRDPRGDPVRLLDEITMATIQRIERLTGPDSNATIQSKRLALTDTMKMLGFMGLTYYSSASGMVAITEGTSIASLQVKSSQDVDLFSVSAFPTQQTAVQRAGEGQSADNKTLLVQGDAQSTQHDIHTASLSLLSSSAAARGIHKQDRRSDVVLNILTSSLGHLNTLHEQAASFAKSSSTLGGEQPADGDHEHDDFETFDEAHEKQFYNPKRLFKTLAATGKTSTNVIQLPLWFLSQSTSSCYSESAMSITVPSIFAILAAPYTTLQSLFKLRPMDELQQQLLLRVPLPTSSACYVSEIPVTKPIPLAIHKSLFQLVHECDTQQHDVFLLMRKMRSRLLTTTQRDISRAALQKGQGYIEHLFACVTNTLTQLTSLAMPFHSLSHWTGAFSLMTNSLPGIPLPPPCTILELSQLIHHMYEIACGELLLLRRLAKTIQHYQLVNDVSPGESATGTPLYDLIQHKIAELSSTRPVRLPVSNDDSLPSLSRVHACALQLPMGIVPALSQLHQLVSSVVSFVHPHHLPHPLNAELFDSPLLVNAVGSAAAMAHTRTFSHSSLGFNTKQDYHRMGYTTLITPYVHTTINTILLALPAIVGHTAYESSQKLPFSSLSFLDRIQANSPHTKTHEQTAYEMKHSRHQQSMWNYSLKQLLGYAYHTHEKTLQAHALQQSTPSIDQQITITQDDSDAIFHRFRDVVKSVQIITQEVFSTTPQPPQTSNTSTSPAPATTEQDSSQQAPSAEQVDDLIDLSTSNLEDIFQRQLIDPSRGITSTNKERDRDRSTQRSAEQQHKQLQHRLTSLLEKLNAVAHCYYDVYTKLCLAYETNNVHDIHYYQTLLESVQRAQHCIGALVHQTLLLLSRYLIASLGSVRNSLRFNIVLTSIFNVMLVNGLCRKPDESDEDGDGEGDGADTSGGVGMGEGEGNKDVSNQITDEEQLLGTKNERQQDNNLNEDEVDHDTGVDMDTDFDGQLMSAPKKEDENDQDDDRDDDEEMSREMGDLDSDDDQNVVDEKLWNKDEDNEKDIDRSEEKREESKLDGANQEDNELVAGDDDPQDNDDKKKDPKDKKKDDKLNQDEKEKQPKQEPQVEEGQDSDDDSNQEDMGQINVDDEERMEESHGIEQNALPDDVQVDDPNINEDENDAAGEEDDEHDDIDQHDENQPEQDDSTTLEEQQKGSDDAGDGDATDNLPDDTANDQDTNMDDAMTDDEGDGDDTESPDNIDNDKDDQNDDNKDDDGDNEHNDQMTDYDLQPQDHVDVPDVEQDDEEDDEDQAHQHDVGEDQPDQQQNAQQTDSSHGQASGQNTQSDDAQDRQQNAQQQQQQQSNEPPHFQENDQNDDEDDKNSANRDGEQSNRGVGSNASRDQPEQNVSHQRSTEEQDQHEQDDSPQPLKNPFASLSDHLDQWRKRLDILENNKFNDNFAVEEEKKPQSGHNDDKFDDKPEQDPSKPQDDSNLGGTVEHADDKEQNDGFVVGDVEEKDLDKLQRHEGAVEQEPAPSADEQSKVEEDQNDTDNQPPANESNEMGDDNDTNEQDANDNDASKEQDNSSRPSNAAVSSHIDDKHDGKSSYDHLINDLDDNTELYNPLDETDDLLNQQHQQLMQQLLQEAEESSAQQQSTLPNDDDEMDDGSKQEEEEPVELTEDDLLRMRDEFDASFDQYNSDSTQYTNSAGEIISKQEHAQQLWSTLTTITHEQAQQLCEQLRIILEPTLTSKLQGDYRTGKRINIKKIIPFIASQFKRDKIWLRRTAPAKRNYQVLIAIDNSHSMKTNNASRVALESVAILCQALTQLEVGEISVCSFGNDVKLLHPFSSPFTSENGAYVVSQFSFDQQQTNWSNLLGKTTQILDFARETKANQGNADGTENLQLVFIISDARIQQDRDYIARLTKEAHEKNQLLCLLIVDSFDPRKSIVTAKKVTAFGNGNMVVTGYLDDFPLPYYTIVRDIHTLPEIIAEALREWFEMVQRS